MTGRVGVLPVPSPESAAAAAAALGEVRPCSGGPQPRAAGTVAERVRAAGGSAGEPKVADITSLAEVRALAELLLAAHERVHVVVNDAGTLAAGRPVTVDGHGKTSRSITSLRFCLSNLLLERLRASTPARGEDLHAG